MQNARQGDSAGEPRNVIYALFHVDEPDRVRYVGMTTRGLSTRLRHHFNAARTSVARDYAVYRWMRKHGEDKIGARAIEVCDSVADLPAAEIKWIAHFDTFGSSDGLNMTAGGEGQFGRRATAEERLRLSLAHLGQDRTLETRLKIGNANLGSKNDLAKLTEAEVAYIKRAIFLGMGGAILGRLFGVSTAAIADIARGKTWNHVPAPIGPPRRPRSIWGDTKKERDAVLSVFTVRFPRIREEINSGNR